MFRVPIGSSPMVNDIANSMFSAINGDDFRGDVSTVATLRCFFGHRIKDGEGIHVKFTEARYTLPDVENISDGELTKNIVRSDAPFNLSLDENILWIHNLSYTEEGAGAAFEKIRSGYSKGFSGYKENSGIAALYKGMKVLCLYNEERRNVILFVCALNFRKLHYLQAAFLPMFPWYRRGENEKATELDVELIKALTQDDDSQYSACVQRYANQCDFRAATIRRGLQGFETQLEKADLENIRNEVNQLDALIENYHKSIEKQLAERYEKLVRISGLEAKIANSSGEESEIMEYFLCNKRLYFIDTNESKITFAVSDYLTYFDKEQAKVLFANPRSSFNTNGEMVKKLLKAVLLDEKLRVRVCGTFTMNINGSASARRGQNYPGIGICDCIPNPHLEHHSCLGNNERVINDAIRNHDYIGAIEQCVAATKNWNVLDSTVTREFVMDLCENTYACVELPDGRVVKPEDAVKWLDEHEEKHEEKAEG